MSGIAIDADEVDYPDHMGNRLLELIALFIALPLGLVGLKASGIRVSPLPVLWLATAGCLFLFWIARRSGTTTEPSGARTWSRKRALVEVTVTVLAGGPLLFLLYELISDQPAFTFPANNPMVWVIVLVAYPLLSVVPQGIVFRRWFASRYRLALGSGVGMIVVGAVCFGFSHVIFLNPTAPLLTLVGGAIFLRTYLRSGSGWIADLQHALLGDIAFTIGYGQWLYAGPVG